MPSLLFRWFAGFLFLCTLFVGCQRQVSLENYSKLQAGQSFDEVKKILGDPAHCDEALGIRSCLWGDEQRGIHINFVAGQVVLLSAKNLK